MTLLERISCKDNLFSAWSRVNKNPHSYGIDLKKIQSYRNSIYPSIASINRRLLNGTYTFSPLRAHRHYAKGKKTRIIQIPTVEDRIVQRAILNVAGKKLSADFSKCSYGYIEKSGIQDALKAILEYREMGYFFVLEADIVKFFDTVNKEKLLNDISSRLKQSKRVIKLLRDALDVEIGNPEALTSQEIAGFNNNEIGIPQGGVLSPLFANMYLTVFDNKLCEAHFKLVRYADDFIVLCKTIKEANDAYILCKEILENELELKLHPLDALPGSKTRICNFKTGFKYLGLQFGLTDVIPAEASRKTFVAKVNDLTNYNRTQCVVDNLMRLSNLIHGWGNAYGFCKNSRTMIIFESLDSYVKKRIGGMLLKHRFLSSPHALSNNQLCHLKIPSLSAILKRA